MRNAATRRKDQLGQCLSCGKRSFVTRDGARQAAKKIDRAMRAYRCPTNEWVWHFGHLPQSIVRGLVTRDIVYPASSRRTA